MFIFQTYGKKNQEKDESQSKYGRKNTGEESGTYGRKNEEQSTYGRKNDQQQVQPDAKQSTRSKTAEYYQKLAKQKVETVKKYIETKKKVVELTKKSGDQEYHPNASDFQVQQEQKSEQPTVKVEYTAPEVTKKHTRTRTQYNSYEPSETEIQVIPLDILGMWDFAKSLNGNSGDYCSFKGLKMGKMKANEQLLSVLEYMKEMNWLNSDWTVDTGLTQNQDLLAKAILAMWCGRGESYTRGIFDGLKDTTVHEAAINIWDNTSSESVIASWLVDQGVGSRGIRFWETSFQLIIGDKVVEEIGVVADQKTDLELDWDNGQEKGIYKVLDNFKNDTRVGVALDVLGDTYDLETCKDEEGNYDVKKIMDAASLKAEPLLGEVKKEKTTVTKTDIKAAMKLLKKYGDAEYQTSEGDTEDVDDSSEYEALEQACNQLSKAKKITESMAKDFYARLNAFKTLVGEQIEEEKETKATTAYEKLAGLVVDSEAVQNEFFYRDGKLRSEEEVTALSKFINEKKGKNDEASVLAAIKEYDETNPFIELVKTEPEININKEPGEELKNEPIDGVTNEKLLENKPGDQPITSTASVFEGSGLPDWLVELGKDPSVQAAAQKLEEANPGLLALFINDQKKLLAQGIGFQEETTDASQLVTDMEGYIALYQQKSE